MFTSVIKPTAIFDNNQCGKRLTSNSVFRQLGMKPLTSQFTVVCCLVCVGALLTTDNAAAADVVPKFNVRPSCNSPARRLVVVGHAKVPEACLKHEKEAHEVLIKHWSRYALSDKTNCVGKVSYGGPPSYIELLSCFETMEHARKIREAHRKELRASRSGKEAGREQ